MAGAKLMVPSPPGMTIVAAKPASAAASAAAPATGDMAPEIIANGKTGGISTTSQQTKAAAAAAKVTPATASPSPPRVNTWRSDADKPRRQALRTVVLQSLQLGLAGAPPSVVATIPQLAKRLEARLYKSAPSMDAYMNESTLCDRMLQVLHHFAKKDPSLVATVEALVMVWGMVGAQQLHTPGSDSSAADRPQRDQVLAWMMRSVMPQLLNTSLSAQEQAKNAAADPNSSPRGDTTVTLDACVDLSGLDSSAQPSVQRLSSTDPTYIAAAAAAAGYGTVTGITVVTGTLGGLAAQPADSAERCNCPECSAAAAAAAAAAAKVSAEAAAAAAAQQQQLPGMRRGFLNSKKGAAKGGGGGGSGGAGAKGQVTPLSSPTRSGSDGSSADVRTNGTPSSPGPEANASPQQPPAAASPQAISGSDVAQAAAASPTTAPESNAAPAFVAPTMVSFVVPATAEAAAEPPAVFRIGVQTEDADGNPIPPRTIVRGAQRYRAAAAAGAAARAAAPVDIPFGAPAAPAIDAATFEFGAPVAGDGAAAAAAPDAVAVVAQRVCGSSAPQAPSTPPQQAQGLKRKGAATGATGAANGVHDMYVVVVAPAPNGGSGAAADGEQQQQLTAVAAAAAPVGAGRSLPRQQQQQQRRRRQGQSGQGAGGDAACDTTCVANALTEQDVALLQRVRDAVRQLPAWSRDTVVSRQRMERKVQRYHTDLLPSAQEALMQTWAAKENMDSENTTKNSKTGGSSSAAAAAAPPLRGRRRRQAAAAAAAAHATTSGGSGGGGGGNVATPKKSLISGVCGSSGAARVSECSRCGGTGGAVNCGGSPSGVGCSVGGG